MPSATTALVPLTPPTDSEVDGLIETLDILSDRALVQRLIEAESEFASGGGRTFIEIVYDLQD